MRNIQFHVTYLFMIFYINSQSQTKKEEPMRIHFSTNEGGFADWMEVDAHTTISSLLAANCPNTCPNDVMIRVNSKAVEPGYVLNDGDRVTATPKKVDGGN